MLKTEMNQLLKEYRSVGHGCVLLPSLKYGVALLQLEQVLSPPHGSAGGTTTPPSLGIPHIATPLVVHCDSLILVLVCCSDWVECDGDHCKELAPCPHSGS